MRARRLRHRCRNRVFYHVAQLSQDLPQLIEKCQPQPTSKAETEDVRISARPEKKNKPGVGRRFSDNEARLFKLKFLTRSSRLTSNGVNASLRRRIL